MKLKLHELVALNYELNGMMKQNDDKSTQVVLTGLLKQKMNMTLRAYVLRLNKVLAEEIKMYEELRMELYKKYGSEEEGQIRLNEKSINDFNKEHTELLLAEKEINTENLWGDSLTIKDLAGIETDEEYNMFIKLVEGK